MLPGPGSGRLRAAALLVVATHVLASAATLVCLRPGLPMPGSEPAERAAWIASHRALWSLGWGTWQLAAVCLIVLYAMLLWRWSEEHPCLAAELFVVAVGGLGFDMYGQFLAIETLPTLRGDRFAALESWVGTLTARWGNIGYTWGGAGVVWLGLHEAPVIVTVAGVVMSLGGLALAISELSDTPLGLVASTAVLMSAVIVWAGGIAWWLRRAS